MGVLAFAGAANAGNITAAAISGVTVHDGDDLTPYTIASEVAVGSAGLLSTASTSSIAQNLSSPLALTDNATVDLVVTYTLSGSAEFGAVAVANLEATGSAVAGAPTTGIVAVSADKKSATFYVTFTATEAGDIDGFELSNLAIKVTGKQDVSIASETRLTAGGVATTIDTMTAKKIVTFAAAVDGFSSTTNKNAIADLSDFTTFNGGADSASSNALGLSLNDGVFYGTLAGGTPLTVAAIFDGGTAVLTGPQVETFNATIGGADFDPDTVTPTSGEYALSDDDLVNGVLTLTQAADAVAIDAGSYSAVVTPKYATGFAGSVSETLKLLTISLDGTNFVAPWFALANPSATSTLRLANNGSSVSGPVIISLKANNGAAAPTGTFTLADGIPAGGFVSVTGAQLKAAFGTTATNGDLQVTIQSDVQNVSAKVRTQQATGQIFENSLNTLKTNY